MSKSSLFFKVCPKKNMLGFSYTQQDIFQLTGMDILKHFPYFLNKNIAKIYSTKAS